jgi:hypothetical protein
VSRATTPLTRADGVVITPTIELFIEGKIREQMDYLISNLGLLKGSEGLETHTLKFTGLYDEAEGNHVAYGLADESGLDFFPLRLINATFTSGVETSRLHLFRKNFGDYLVASGEGQVAGRDALAVVSRDPEGETRVTVRFRPLPGAEDGALAPPAGDAPAEPAP